MNRIFIALLSIICFSFLSFGQQANLKTNFLDTTNLNNITSILDYENQIMSMVDSLSTEDLIDYYKKGLSACQAIQNDTLARIFADNTLRMYLFENDMTNMEKYARIALVHSENSGKAKLIAYQHLTLATSFLGADNVTAAIEEFLKVIEISNHHEVNKEYEYSALMSLGFSFYLLGEIEQSMLYLKSAERFFLENENKHKDIYLANIYVGIAGGFFDQENKDSSDFYINQTILALQRVESDTSLNKTQVETIIADIYFDLIEYALLEDKIFEAGIYYDKIKDFKIFDRERKYIIEVEFFLKKNEFEKVKELISNPPEELPLGFEIDLLKSTASYYEKIGNHKKSLSFFKQYNEKKVAQMKSQQIKFSTYTKERIESVNQKGEIEKLTQEKTFQSKLNKVSMFILACLGGTIALLIYVFFQARTKNRLLNKNIEDEKTIKLQLQQIQQVEHEKNKLFTNIAHELQTPLSIIQGLSKRLYHSNELTGDTGEALQIINKNSRYLSEKTNQILSIDLPSQDDSSSGFLWFSLSHLLEYVLPEFYFLAEEKSIKIHEMDDFDSEIFIYSDVNRITTILKNILSNAIKYTNKNGSISIRRAVKNSDYYEIIIEDTGRGIAEEKLPNIFDRYYQVSTEAEGGFGLGLAICQEYIKSLKGKIEVTSTLGKGSSFFIQIPKIIPDDLSENREIYQFPQNDFLKQKALDKKTESTAHTEHHLLIVEDNIDFCKYLKTILKDEYNLAFAHNGSEALDYLKINMPDLIITDWMMQTVDGLALVQRLKKTKEFNHLPILMLTARSLPSDKIKALRVGIDDYLIKPIEDNLLKDRIKYLLYNTDQRAEFEPSILSPILSKDGQSLTISAQNWLFKMEEIIFPLIHDFDLNLEQVAALGNTNVTQLNKKMKETTGLTAKKYIQEIRYWEARRMLEAKEYDSVKAICLSVGFKDQKNFSRKFKKRFGVYPSEYLQD